MYHDPLIRHLLMLRRRQILQLLPMLLRHCGVQLRVLLQGHGAVIFDINILGDFITSNAI